MKGTRREDLRSWVAYAVLPATGIITGPLLSRALGPAGRGELAAIFQPLTIADALAALGLPVAITYNVAKGRDPKLTQRRGLVLALLSAGITLVALFGYAAHVSDTQRIPLVLLTLTWSTVVLGALIAVRRAVVAGTGQWRLLDAERMSAGLLRLFGVVLLAVLAVQEAGFYVLVFLGSGLLAAVWLLQPLATRASTQDAPRFRDILRMSLTAAPGAIAVAANSRLDQAMLPVLVDRVQLGWYATAVTVAEVPMVVGTVLYRNTLTESSAGVSGMELARRAAPAVAAAFVPAMLLPSTAGWLMGSVFGPSFRPAAPLAVILAFGTGLTVMSQFMVAFVTGRGHVLTASLVNILGALATVALFALLADRMSATVAAWVSFGTQLGVSVLLASFVLIGSVVRSGRLSRVFACQSEDRAIAE